MEKLNISHGLQKLMSFSSKILSLKGVVKFAAVILISALSVGVVSAGSPVLDFTQWLSSAGDVAVKDDDVIKKEPFDGSKFFSQDVPKRLEAGEEILVTIRMKNTGTSTWTREAGFKLGSQNPQDNTLWTGGTRILLSRSDSIAPGQIKEFTFMISAPSKPGTYKFQWRMVKEGVHWFGHYSHPTFISVRAPNEGDIEKGPVDKADFISQSVPELMRPGQIVQVSITMENTGTSTWTRAGGFKLGSQNSQDNKRWTGETRVYLDASDSIAPGKRKTFTFNISAPTEPGLYPFQWRMVHEGIGWFGRHSRNLMIRVKSPDNSEFISQNVPDVLQPGQKTQITITMENTGDSTWTRVAGFKLGSQDPQDNKLWAASTRIYLDPADSVAPGERKTFTFEITAPSEPGLYPFQWRMVREGIGWFGRHSRHLSIRVKAPEGPPENSPTPLSTNMPATHTPEKTASPTPTPVASMPPKTTSTPNIPPTLPPEKSPTDPPEVEPTFTPTPTPDISPTHTPTPVVWEEDTFDTLPTGALIGKNGWRKVQASARVVASDGGGNLAMIDPSPNMTIVMDKNVPKQSEGQHRFEFDVMVEGATEASLAKIEMRTNTSAGWDKKFQLYFGSSMRVNYSPKGAATNIVPATKMGHWYHIRCDMDLDTGKMDIWVDGTKVVSGIPMHPGPIRGLSLSGWDRAGMVSLDNLVGRSD
jgi:hypothetical protein